MQFAVSVLALAGVAASVQTVNLVLHTGTTSYTMSIPADGSIHDTNNALDVSIIDDNDFNAYSQCEFITAGEKTMREKFDADGGQHILVDPAQPILQVSCQGMCVPVYGECYGSNGQYVGPCCNGYCAATRCRPWTIASS